MYQEIIRILSSDLFHWFFLVAAGFLVLAGAAMLYGIKMKGKVILIGALIKNKHYDNEKLKARYLIQSIYTMVLGAALFVVTALGVTTGVTIMCGIFAIGIGDGLYDYFAIKAALKRQNDVREVEPQQ